MWVHLPSTSPACSPASASSTAPSKRLCRALARSFFARGKPLPATSWSKLCARASWMKRLCGTISAASTPGRFEAWLTSLSPDRPARSSPSPAASKATKGRGRGARATARSRTSSASSESVAPPWSSLRTFLPGSQAAGFDPSEKNYAEWVSQSKDLSSSVRKMLERRIEGSVCSSWPTHTVKSDGDATENRGLSLPRAAENWHTPNVPNGGRASSEDDVAAKGATNRGKRQIDLSSEVQHWPTPDAQTFADGFEATPQEWQDRRDKLKETANNGNGCGTPLAMAANLWWTPISSERAQAPRPVSLPARPTGKPGHVSSKLLRILLLHYRDMTSGNERYKRFLLDRQAWHKETFGIPELRKKRLGVNFVASLMASPFMPAQTGCGVLAIPSSLCRLAQRCEFLSREAVIPNFFDGLE